MANGDARDLRLSELVAAFSLGAERGNQAKTAVGPDTRGAIRDDTIRQTVRRMADDGQLDTDGQLLRTASVTCHPCHPCHKCH